MSSSFRLLSIAALIGILSASLLPSQLVGLAAPAALPNCGHNIIGGSIKDIVPSSTVLTGPPDIAKSADAAETYTAVVWTDGTTSGIDGTGQLKLAYSNILTTTRSWNIVTVGSDSKNINPSVAFDPSISTTIHIAYQHRDTAANETGIRYAKCDLNGTCPLFADKIIETGQTDIIYKDPKIAVNAAGDPVIVYVKEDGSGPVTIERVHHVFIPNDGGVTVNAETVFPTSEINRRVTGATDDETHPALAYSNSITEIMHVAFAVDEAPFGAIRYRQMNVGGELSGRPDASLVNSVGALFNEDLGNGSGNASKPAFPAIEAISNTVSLVWELHISTTTDFLLGYKVSDNQGANWGPTTGGSGVNTTYRHNYLPSGNLSSAAFAASDRRPSDIIDAAANDYRLRPDVTMHMNGSITITHVAWHEDVTSAVENLPVGRDKRRDIMYSYYDHNANQWKGTRYLSPTTTAITVSNVTTVYGESLADPERQNKGNLDNVRARIVFNKPSGLNRQRLQIVHMGWVTYSTQAQWNLRYNGWELGSNFASPVSSERDTDCDNRDDAKELDVTGFLTVSCTGDPTDGGWAADGNGDGNVDGLDHANCNDNLDAVPDFMDINSDGDFQADDNPNEEDPREFTNAGGIFVPVILKSS